MFPALIETTFTDVTCINQVEITSTSVTNIEWQISPVDTAFNIL